MQLGFEPFYILETRKHRIHVYVWTCEASCETHGKILKQVEANMWVLRVIPIYFPATPISATLSFSS